MRTMWRACLSTTTTIRRVRESGAGALSRARDALSGQEGLSLGVGPEDCGCSMNVVDPKLSEFAANVLTQKFVAFSSDNGEIPEELANETILKSSPSFVVLSRSNEDAEGLVSRLDSLFPQSPTIVSVARNVFRQGKPVSTVGAAVFAENFDELRREVPWSTSPGFAATGFNKNANRLLFYTTFQPQETLDVTEKVAVFALGPRRALPMFPGAVAEFFVFENRYKLMIKECAENRVPLLLYYPEAAVLCDLVDYQRHDSTGASRVRLRATRRARVDTMHPPAQHEFDLARATVEIVSDDEPPNSLQHLLDNATLKAFRDGPLRSVFREENNLREENETSPEEISFEVAAALDRVGDLDYDTKRFWFDTEDTEARLQSQISYIERIVDPDSSRTENATSSNDSSTS